MDLCAFNVFWTNQDGAFAEGILRSLDMMISALGFHCHCHYIRNNRYKPIVFLEQNMCFKPWICRSSAWLKFQNYIRSFLHSNFIKKTSLINIHKHMNLEPKLFTKKPTKRKLGADVNPFIIFPLHLKFHENFGSTQLDVPPCSWRALDQWTHIFHLCSPPGLSCHGLMWLR